MIFVNNLTYILYLESIETLASICLKSCIIPKLHHSVQYIILKKSLLIQ